MADSQLGLSRLRVVRNLGLQAKMETVTWSKSPVLLPWIRFHYRYILKGQKKEQEHSLPPTIVGGWAESQLREWSEQSGNLSEGSWRGGSSPFPSQCSPAFLFALSSLTSLGGRNLFQAPRYELWTGKRLEVAEEGICLGSVPHTPNFRVSFSLFFLNLLLESLEQMEHWSWQTNDTPTLRANTPINRVVCVDTKCGCSINKTKGIKERKGKSSHQPHPPNDFLEHKRIT